MKAKEFKVGDKVKCVSLDLYTHFHGFNSVDVYEIIGVYGQTNTVQVKMPCGKDSSWWRADRFELANPFDMKTQPWFIRFNNEQEFNLIQDFLLENYGVKIHSQYKNVNEYGSTYLTNTSSYGIVSENLVMHGCCTKSNAKEIKLNFKTVIDSVEYPEAEVKPSAEQIEIQKIEQEMRNLADRLNNLKDNK